MPKCMVTWSRARTCERVPFRIHAHASECPSAFALRARSRRRASGSAAQRLSQKQRAVLIEWLRGFGSGAACSLVCDWLADVACTSAVLLGPASFVPANLPATSKEGGKPVATASNTRLHPLHCRMSCVPATFIELEGTRYAPPYRSSGSRRMSTPHLISVQSVLIEWQLQAIPASSRRPSWS